MTLRYWQIQPTKPKHYCIVWNETRAGIGLYVNAHKTEYMCYNQTGDISTLEGTPLKLVDKFTYLGSSVSSSEKDIDTQLTKAWTAIDRLSIIGKSDLTDKMKRSFFQTAVVSIQLHGCTTWTLTKRLVITQECYEQYWSSSLLLQQGPACLFRLTWIVFVMGGRWPYSWCLVGCCRQDLFSIARSILV